MKFIQNLTIAGFFLASTSAGAASITQFGDDVSFTYDDSTLYGTGVVVGNTIFFTPSTFFAESLDGEGLVTATETLHIDVSATTSGFNMTNFTVYEQGDYKQRGSGASASADGYFQATSLTTLCGTPLSPCAGLTLYNSGTLADTGDSLGLWNMGGDLDLASVAGWGSDTDVRLTIQNILTAETLNSGEIAFIQKKFSVSIPQVPVPAAVWLFGSGLLGLVGVARRRVR